MSEVDSQNPFASPQTREPMSAPTSKLVIAPDDPLATELANLPSRDHRFYAGLIDFLVVDMPAYIAAGFLAPLFLELLSVPAGGGAAVIGTKSLPQFLAATLATLFFYGIFQSYLLSTRSQTIGKAALSLKVVRRDGRSASYRRLAFLRYLPWLLFYNLNYFSVQLDPLGPLIILRLLLTSVLLDPLFIFSKERRCLHDYLAGTIVVKA